MKKIQLFMLLSCLISVPVCASDNCKKSVAEYKCTDYQLSQKNYALPEGQIVPIEQQDVVNLVKAIQKKCPADDVSYYVDLFGPEILKHKDPETGNALYEVARASGNSEAATFIQNHHNISYTSNK